MTARSEVRREPGGARRRDPEARHPQIPPRREEKNAQPCGAHGPGHMRQGRH